MDIVRGQGIAVGGYRLDGGAGLLGLIGIAGTQGRGLFPDSAHRGKNLAGIVDGTEAGLEELCLIL